MLDLIGIIVFTKLCAKIDAAILKQKGAYIYKHGSRLFIRTWFILFACNNWQAGIGMALYFAGTFDNTLNALRGKKLWHLGNTAKWDQLFKPVPRLYKAVVFTSIAAAWYLLIKYGSYTILGHNLLNWLP